MAWVGSSAVTNDSILIITVPTKISRHVPEKPVRSSHTWHGNDRLLTSGFR